MLQFIKIKHVLDFGLLNLKTSHVTVYLLQPMREIYTSDHLKTSHVTVYRDRC